MLLKRIYNWKAPKKEWTTREDDCEPCKGKGVIVNDAGDGVMPCPEKCVNGILKKNIPPVVGVQILRANDRMHFSPRLIEQGSIQGWLTLSDGKLIIKGQDNKVSYKIEHTPGFFCCHCEKPLGDGSSGAIHVQGFHKNKKSPDPGNPAGYRKDNFFDCVKED